MTIQENVTLAPLTTLRVGGPARYFASAHNEDEVREALDFARTHQLSLFVLGGGSNVVIADRGWQGLVLHVVIGGLSRESSDNSVLFCAGSGHDWDAFVAQAVAQDCAGIECLSGIPGKIGGTPVQNVGAYGQEVADTVESVRAFDMKEDRIVVLPKPACRFGYRRSIFNTSERGRYIILGVNYRLQRGGTPTLKYGDLQKHFSHTNAVPTLAEVREAVSQIRRSKGMLIVPGDDDSLSAGSFFKNPVLTAEKFKELAEQANVRGLILPSYPALETQHKISAAWLVEHSGFSKGFRLGPAAISTKHALALINTGQAEAKDIVKLQETIQQGVATAWGVRLETEPVFVGF